MIRNKELEIEMLSISKYIWMCFKTSKPFPAIESKQGGSTAAYYPREHKIRYRWNSWAKMPMAGKRMIAIHELWHATGQEHDSSSMFAHAYDIVTIEIYKRIFGEDAHYKDALAELTAIINGILVEPRMHRLHPLREV